MDGMITIVVQMKITRENGEVILEMVGQCEGEYRGLALYMFEQNLDKVAERLGIRKTFREEMHESHQFYRAFIFPNEGEIERFLSELQAEQ